MSRCKNLYVCLAFFAITASFACVLAWTPVIGQQSGSTIPSQPLAFGVFTARFNPDSTFKIEGDRWPAITGTWKIVDGQIELLESDTPQSCKPTGRYRFRVE